MAPAKHCGVGKQQNRNGHKSGTQKTEMIAEGVAHQSAGLDGRGLAGQLACGQIQRTGAKNRQRRQRTYNNCIREHLKDAPHTLAHRFLYIGAGMYQV